MQILGARTKELHSFLTATLFFSARFPFRDVKATNGSTMESESSSATEPDVGEAVADAAVALPSFFVVDARKMPAPGGGGRTPLPVEPDPEMCEAAPWTSPEVWCW